MGHLSKQPPSTASKLGCIINPQSATKTILQTREGEGMHPSAQTFEENCYQFWHELPNIDGHYPVIGTWMIDEKCAGMGIRETIQSITDGHAQFVPHIIDSPPLNPTSSATSDLNKTKTYF